MRMQDGVAARALPEPDTEWLEGTHPPAEVTPPKLVAAQPPSRSTLRVRLVTGDVVATALGWVLAVVAWPSWSQRPAAALLLIASAVVMTMVALAWQRLYLARVCSIQSIEIQRLGRAVTAALGLLAVLAVATPSDVAILPLLVGTAATFTLLVVHRMAYRAWLNGQRRGGRFHRPVVLVGSGPDAAALEQLLCDHPESGFELLGTIGPPSNSERFRARWLAEADDAAAAAQQLGATGAIVETSVWSPIELNQIVRSLLRAGLHVHVSSGLQGISPRRMSVVPVVHEPLFYVEGVEFGPWQLRAKRVLDIVVAVVLGIVSLPIIAVAAVAIKLDDGGPVLFRQERVGQGNRAFEMLKLRTMAVDADRRLAEVANENHRSGPLFKAVADPRITRVGAFLRASSIDELPQLWNVIRGSMSMVGPRPALASEVAQFDEDLLRSRLDVPPGLTGLWQIEARDNPAFGPYRRLDIFYVENWSVWLDLSILVATVGVVVSRTFRALPLPRRRRAGGTPVRAVLD